jgi:potassium channel subfamily K
MPAPVAGAVAATAAVALLPSRLAPLAVVGTPDSDGDAGGDGGGGGGGDVPAAAATTTTTTALQPPSAQRIKSIRSTSSHSQQQQQHHAVSFAQDVDGDSDSNSEDDAENVAPLKGNPNNSSNNPSASPRHPSLGGRRVSKQQHKEFARTASHIAARQKPLLLLEVICCAPGNDDDYSYSDNGHGSATPFSGRTEGDRLVSSATLDLESFLLSAGKPGRASLDLTDVETLDEQGQVNIVVEWRPMPIDMAPPTMMTPGGGGVGGTVATPGSPSALSPMSKMHRRIGSVTRVLAPGAAPILTARDGYFHVEVVALIGLRDPFNEMEFRSALADWSLMAKMAFAVLLYLAAGVIFYTHYEGWTLLEAVYFCVVTATTTGYGDLKPSTLGSRLFTLFFILVGIGMIAIAVGIAGGLMLERQEQEMYRAMMAEKTRAAAGKDVSANAAKNQKSVGGLRGLLQLSHTGKRLLGSFFLFHLVLWCGTLGFMHLEPGVGFFDALYLCVVTMSTVGYGGTDAPSSNAARAFCIPWIIVSAVSVSRIIGDVTNAYMTHARNARAEAVLKNSIQSVEDLAALDDDNSGEVSELEFLKHMLVRTRKT